MRKIIILLPIILLLLSCSSKQNQVERIIEDGVEVVINHIKPYKIKNQPSSLSLEKEFSIDTEDDSIAGLGLTDLWASNVGPNGNMYLWNAPVTKENLVYKFDSNGNFLGQTELDGYQAKFNGDRVYCLKEKDSGYKELVVYQTIWD